MQVREAVPNLRVFYLLLIGVGSILAHLATEFGAMGSDADAVLFSPRHWYLGCAAVAGIITFFVRGRAVLAQATNVRDLKRLLGLGLDRLPWRAKGTPYFVVTAGLQLGIGSLTQIGEGCPFCSHDVVAGLLGALLTVVLLALLTHVLRLRLPNIVCALVGHLAREAGPPAATFVRPHLGGATASLGVWFPLLFNRPPPHLQYQFASALS
jgi:hypothetical protein